MTGLWISIAVSESPAMAMAGNRGWSASLTPPASSPLLHQFPTRHLRALRSHLRMRQRMFPSLRHGHCTMVRLTPCSGTFYCDWNGAKRDLILWLIACVLFELPDSQLSSSSPASEKPANAPLPKATHAAPRAPPKSSNPPVPQGAPKGLPSFP